MRFSAHTGVDCPEAVKWLRKTADQGAPSGQFLLGYMYERGLGLPQDYVLAYMWLNLAAAHGDEKWKNHRDLIAKIVSAPQLAEAQKLAREWKPIKQTDR
jgi:TPR repeat protein